METLDLLIVLSYFAILLGIGVYTKKKEGKVEDSADFFVAKRKMPWGAVLMSIIATEISAITFLGTPSAGFHSNMNYIQFAFGSILGRIFIATLFIGAFYKSNCITIYDYLALRFGQSTRYAATAFFFVTRILASGVRLMVAATSVAIVMGWPVVESIIIFSVIAVIYTALGGIKAIIWTDVVQGTVFLLGGVIVIIYLISTIEGGAATIFSIGSEAGKFEIFRFTPKEVEGKSMLWSFFNDGTFFLIAIINGCVTTFAALGTDHDLAQRMLTCKNANQSRFSVILSGFLDIPIVFGFLFIGVALYAFYQLNPDPDMPMKLINGASVVDHDKVFSHFISSSLPTGLRGFLFVGVLAAAMSSLDSALGALSSSAAVDVYKPLMKGKVTEHKMIWVARINIGIFGCFLSYVAFLLKDMGDILWLPFKIGGITYGALLGVFLLGVTSKASSNKANIIGMISSSATLAVLLVLIETGKVDFAWSWLIVIGTVWTYAVGFFGARLGKS